MSITFRQLLAGAALALLMGSAAGASDHVPGELLVRWKPRTLASARAQAMEGLGAERLASFHLAGLERLRVDGVSVEEAVARLALDTRVEYAEPNYLWSIDRTPDDALYPEQWGFHNSGQTGGLAGSDIHAEAAWERFTGEPALLIGNIDTGAQYDHPDLAANIWTNPGEVPGNGVDDDGNGYVDDVHGYDFLNHDGDPRDDNGHGTHTTGTIAAVGNNGIGVTGVVWRAKIVVLKFLGSTGSGPTSAAVEALEYATRLGVRLTNNSWGGALYSRALEDAIDAAGAAGQLFVAAAGNARSDTDLHPQYPSALGSDCIVSVAATDHADQLASFSNYGLTSVDLAAPGVDILSTAMGDNYRLLSGTSMASPHVAGACAFLMGRFPAMPAAEVKSRLLRFSDPLPGLAGRCVSGGRLNLELAAADPDSVPPGGIADLAVTSAGSNSLDLAWTATGDDGSAGTASRYELRVATEPITPETFASSRLVTATAPHLAGSSESRRVRGLENRTTYWFAMLARDEFGNPGSLSNVATGTTLGPPTLALSPQAVAAAANTGELVERDVELQNDSPGTLEWESPPPELDFGLAQQSWPAEELAKGSDGPVREPQMSATGGPDAFGYRWADSSEPGGPVYQWVDIARPEYAVALSGDEAVSEHVPLGFSFPFYGRRFTQVRLCTNGYLEFGNEGPNFINTGLPSSKGPRNLIAVFWDDLHLGSGVDRAFLHYDGTRCVMSWEGVSRFNDVQSVMTFQCILYPSGEIRFQYRSMTGTTSAATVGIQDTTRTVGLLVAFNQAYVRDGLAVRIVPLRQWLAVEPSSGFVPAGGRQSVRLRMDAAGLASGEYHGRVRLLTNDPAAADTTVAVSLAVTGAPHLVLSPTALEFGAHFTGARDTLQLTVANDGVDPLVVREARTDSPAFTVAGAGFSLLPGEAATLPVTFSPAGIAESRGSLTLASNDPQRPLATLPLHGVGSAAPEIEPQATRLEAATTTTLDEAAVRQERLLVLRNSGGATLEWTASAYQGLIGTAPGLAASEVPPPVAQVKGAMGPGVGTLGDGGPDAFGYRWQDSDSPGGPAFEWQEISGVGTRLFGGADDSSTTVSLPFPFTFYGRSYSQVHVCTNGFLSFTDRDSSLVNTDLPNAAEGVPRALVAPYWTDLDLRAARGAGRVYAHHDGSKFIVEWKDAVHFSGAGPYTFQVLLWPSGTIEYQYQELGALLDAATVGIQDENGVVGLRVAYNVRYAHPGLRVRLSFQEDWLRLDRTSGRTPPGGADTLRVTFDARGHRDGDYAGEVRVQSNDVEQPLLAVPCGMHVGLHDEAGEAHPGALASVSESPVIRFLLSPPDGGSAVRLASLRLDGHPVAAVGEPQREVDGRLSVAIRAVDVMAVVPGGEGRPVTLSGEYDVGGWFAAHATLSIAEPDMAGGPIPKFGSAQPTRRFRGHEAIGLAWIPPDGEPDGYSVAYSSDRGLRWTTVGGGTLPRFEFIPPDTTTGAMLEVVARRGDSVLGTWLSAPFEVDLEAVAVAPRLPPRFALRSLGPEPARGSIGLMLALTEAGEARVEVFDVRGARIRTIFAGALEAGEHPLPWDGRSESGGRAAPGVYLVRARSGARAAIVRVSLLR